MRILHIIDNMQAAMGGPPVIAMAIARHQVRMGHEVHIVFYDFAEDDSQAHGVLSQSPSDDDITVHLLTKPSRFELLFGRSASKKLAQLIPGFDALHIHNLWEGLLRQAAKIAHENKVPYAVLLNGMLDEWSMKQSRWKKLIALKIGVKQMLKNATYLQIGNEAEKAMLEKLSIHAPCKKIPNGINPDLYEKLPETGTFYKAQPALANKPFILFLSRLHYKKGLDLLAEAFAEACKDHADLQLVIAGPDDGALTSLQSQLQTLQLTDRVHLVGPLYGEMKLAALNDAQFFCLPSRQEGFSVAILEALACAKSVLITEACHFSEVGEAQAGLVVEVKASAIANGIKQMMNDADQLQSMSHNARELVHGNYTWPVLVEEITKAYRVD